MLKKNSHLVLEVYDIQQEKAKNGIKIGTK